MKTPLAAIFLFNLLVASGIYAQNKQKHYAHMAMKSFKAQDFNSSIKYHLKLDSLIPGSPEIRYNIGVCYLNSNYKTNALPYLEFAKEKHIQNPELNYMLGKAYHYNHKFDQAKKCFEDFLKELNNDTLHEAGTIKDTKRRIEICEFAKTLVEDSIPIEIENLGKTINSEYDDYVPVVSADENRMYFTSRRKHPNSLFVSHDGKHYEDIYQVEKDEAGQWKHASNIGLPINGLDHDACIGMTADASTIFLYRTKKANPSKGHIYISKLKGKQWETPTRLGSQIDTKRGWEASLSVTEDNHRLYFSSDKPGGYGGLDIWYCDLQADNSWGLPKNAGPSINTRYDEDCPFIHFDDKTLFFSSTGHNTMGGYDVFSSVLNHKDTTFSAPKNLGYPINSTDDDMYFIYSADGSNGYMSKANRPDSHGERDIYIVNRPFHSKQMIVLKSKVIDAETNTPVEAVITVTDLETQKVQGRYHSNSATGECVLALDFGKNYAVHFESDKYIFESENIDIDNPDVIFSEHKTFSLKRVKVGNTLTVNNLFFDYKKADLRPESMPELEKLLHFMETNPQISVEISGYTDSVGSDSYNRKLSNERAVSVKDFLVAKGVSNERIRTKGCGKSKPVASNGTEEGRTKNRRTEVLIYDISTMPSSRISE